MRAAPYAAIAIAVTSVSFSAIFIRWSESDALTIAFFRLALATMIVAPFAAVDLRRSPGALRRRDVVIMAGIGVVLALHFAFWITSLKTEGVTVASSVVLVTSHPLMVGLASHFVLKERVGAKTAIGIAVGLAGVSVIGVASYGFSTATFAGNMLAFLGGVMAGIYFLGGRRLRQRVGIASYAFVVYAAAAITLLAMVLTSGELVPRGDRGRELILFLAMAVVPHIGGHTLFNWSLRHVTAPVVSLSLVGEPIGSTLLAWALLSEFPAPLIGVGAVLALGGIFLTAYGTRTPPIGEAD